MIAEAAASHSGPESSTVGPLSSYLPEQEALELSTTVDPSYIIQLIRQLLPPVHMTDVIRYATVNELENDLKTEGVCSRKEQQDTNIQESLDERANIDTSANIDEISCRSTDNQESSCKKSDPIDFSAQTGRVLNSDRGGHSPSSNGRSEDEAGDMPQRAVDHVATEPTAGPEVPEQREEAGCVLWDLAANQTHAEFMVKNYILDVLLAVLRVPHSDRMREICIGIMGNLACHAVPVKAIVQTPGLLHEIVQNLFVDDSPSLSEACRLLSAGLHSEEVDSWVKAINSEEVLERIIWIAANTMNSFLLDKSTELLLAMVDCQGDSASILLSALVRLGLPAILTDLLASEISAVNEGTCSHGDVVLDTLLQIAETLSLADDIAAQLAANLKLFSLACQVIRLSKKDEVGPAGISATVLVANVLAEEEDLIHEVSRDAVLIKQLLELLPSTGDDPGARNALWSILARLSSAYSAIYQDPNATPEVLLILAERCELLLEDLQDHKDDRMEELGESESTGSFKMKLETAKKFLHIMEDWAACHDPDVDSGIYRTIQSSSCSLKRRLKEIELDESSGSDTKFESHENGQNYFDT